MSNIFDFNTIRQDPIRNKRVLVRVDFDVPLEDGRIQEDSRIVGNIPTIKHLLDRNNKLILIAKLGRPKGKDPELSMKHIVGVLPDYLPGYEFKLIDDFLEENLETFVLQKPNEILVLENIRYYPDDVSSKPDFVKSLSALGDVFVNDAFAMCHREEPSVTGLPNYMQGYAGLLLEKEVHAIMRTVSDPNKPVVAIIGGSKIETKVEPIKKLLEICDHVLVGGGIANTFLKAHGYEIGKSLYEKHECQIAQELIDYATDRPVNLVLPIDARVGDPKDPDGTAHIVSLPVLPQNGHILDIGPATQEIYSEIISQAKTIIWNGPMGMFEHDAFRLGTDEIYRAIIHNHHAFSLVGGGDTLAALAGKRQKDSISHISTGGGAMLELIQFGDLPGLRALRKSSPKKNYI